jgi:protease-4
MKKFVKWLLIISGIFFIFLVGIYFVLTSLFDTEPEIDANSYVELNLGGYIKEYETQESLGDLFWEAPMDMQKIRQVLKMAAVDDRINGVLVNINFLQVGFAKLQELQQLIDEYRHSGKPIIAYLEFAMLRDYYLATACDSICMPPSGNLLIPGISAEVTFYKGLLSKVGIEADFEHIGKYKNAPDIYTEQTMTDAHREVIDEILDNRYQDVVSVISQRRGIEKAEVIHLLENISGFTVEEAREHGLIDGYRYPETLSDFFISNDEQPSRISASTYAEISPSDVGLAKGPRVAVIYCEGTIAGGEDGSDLFLDEIVGADRVVRNLQSAAKSRSIKAIILRIASPGGSAFASDMIWHAVIEARKQKPIIASISDVGASGGYYIAMAADTVVAQTASLIGSIGIYAGKFSMEKLYQKLDLKTIRLARGKNAAIFSLHSKFSPSERKVVQKLINDFYITFVKNVAECRDKTYQDIEQIASGRVWSGREGLAYGLIDTLGGMDVTLALVKKRLALDESDDLRLVYYPRKRTFFEQIIKNIAIFDKNIAGMVREREIFLERYQAKPLALMPFQIDIK